MKRMTVLYDATCPICVRCRMWMEHQPSFVELDFLPCGSSEAKVRFGSVPWLGEELVVVSDAGEVWAGPAAFLMCLWALEGYREWSYRLSGDSFAPMAARFFQALSSKRRWIAAWFDHPTCSSGRCHVQHAPIGPYR